MVYMFLKDNRTWEMELIKIFFPEDIKNGH